MKLIPLSGSTGIGLFSIVDDDIYEFISNRKWTLSKNGYPYIKIRNKSVCLHQIPIGVPLGDMMIDHKNRNKLDCRRENLRYATKAQNSMNREKSKSNKSTSEYKGVSWDKSRGRWHCKVKFDGKTINIGRFSDPIDAAVAYNKKAVELFGEFAYLNKI